MADPRPGFGSTLLPLLLLKILDHFVNRDLALRLGQDRSGFWLMWDKIGEIDSPHPS